MAVLYLRLPHYVAGYLRNRDRNNPLSPGDVITLNQSERIWVDYTEGLRPNFNMRVNRSYCFCQRMWKTMMDGYSVVGRKKRLLSDRYDELTLTDSEVKLLSGLSSPRGDDSGEYVCIAIPREAFRYGKLVPTNSFWELSDVSANTVRSHLVNEFWRALYAYVDKAMDKAGVSGRKFVFIETLDSFMERYQIRCSNDFHERDALKRNYSRRRKSYRFTEEDYVEHG